MHSAQDDGKGSLCPAVYVLVRTLDTFSPLHNRTSFFCFSVGVFSFVFTENDSNGLRQSTTIYTLYIYCDALSLLAVYIQHSVIVDTSGTIALRVAENTIKCLLYTV